METMLTHKSTLLITVTLLNLQMMVAIFLKTTVLQGVNARVLMEECLPRSIQASTMLVTRPPGPPAPSILLKRSYPVVAGVVSLVSPNQRNLRGAQRATGHLLSGHVKQRITDGR